LDNLSIVMEDLHLLIEGIVPDIIDQEQVSGGFRTTKKRYIHQNGVVVETIEYQNPATSDGWASIKSQTFSEGDLQELPIYRSWNISNHPSLQNIFRRVDLVKLEVDAIRVRVSVVVKHFTTAERNIKAPVADRFTTLTAEDDYLINVDAAFIAQGYPAQMGERSYWDLLTNAGFTPYQLLDARVVELDNVGRFNLIYG
jgi:hypothetical protein